jgi:hypothetical protein
MRTEAIYLLAAILGCLVTFCHYGIKERGARAMLEGTLVVAIPTKEGLVVCADKRLHNNFTGEISDTFVKIYKLRKNALFTAVDGIGLIDKQTLKKEFDAFDTVNRFSTEVPFEDNEKYWSGLTAALKEEINQYLLKRSFSDWPESGSKDSGYAMFSVIFYYLDTENLIKSRVLKFRYIKQQPPILDPVVEPASIVKTPKLSGKARLVIDMLSNDPALYEDSQIKELDEKVFDYKAFSIIRATELANRLITISSTRLPEAYISPSCDCAILRYRGGFKWL